MEWYDIEVDGEHTVKFADLPYVPLLSPTQVLPRNKEKQLDNGQKKGGIIRQGKWAWLARNSMLQIISLSNGQTISSYEFCELSGYDSCCIKCVEEIYPHNPDTMLLAVVLESFRAVGGGGGGSFVVLYSIELSCILSSIELGLHATCAKFMHASSCRRSLLQNFDGCLAVGSEEGAVILLNLNIRKIIGVEQEIPTNATTVPCHIMDYSLPLTDIHRRFRQCQQDDVHFGLQMEVIESPCSIQCILPIDLITGIAIGLEDGRMVLYDLAELQIFYIAMPKPELAMSALVKMDYLEPPDDPRPCLYIWALHENGDNLHAVMHNLMYEKRLLDANEADEKRIHSNYFESFLSCSMRLQLPLEATTSVALACQAISTLSGHGRDDSNCLCAISWFSVLEEKNKLLLFDLNQWYKEEMPFALKFNHQPSYLAGYILNGQCTGLHVQLNPNTITHFNSMQRYEEHFYPNSLTFDCTLLHEEGCRRYNWEGAQNRLINLLRISNASIFLEPNNCFSEIMRARLMPQFTELNMNATFSRNAKYDIILSTALENNCISLLRDCAKSWIDCSFMGDFGVSTGLSLSTLTDWIWQRATLIKNRCNDLCKGLFEFDGYPLDNREQKEMGFITRQLKLLYDLLGEILIRANKQIPSKVYSSLEKNQNALRMASNYQDLLLWLLNIGLLPEASPHNAQVNAMHDLVPYPYKQLKDMYKKKRLYFGKINGSFISKKSGRCRLLFIDAFIDHACKGNVLHEYWLENDGDGLYPPNSIEGMLRVMLVPELSYEDKYAILLYFFLDLNMAIDEEQYKGIVSNFIKFPSVFKLSAALIKTVQSFWNLDHDEFLPAVDEFISPFNKNQKYPQWMVELIIESLLIQKASNLALRILESQPALISPVLKLKALLANKLIAEAFHFVRSQNDDSILEKFFTFCLRDGQFGIIRDLALNEKEGLILQSILKDSKAPGAESLHFVYLLQKSKYIEAVSYMDELSTKSKSFRNSMQNQHSGHMDTPNMVLSAYNTTMTPVTQGLTDVYFRIKNKIKKKEVDNKSPVPLSCQLIKQNANSLLGGIYHSSALSAHFATYYWGEMEDQRKNEKHLLSSNNAPFLRKPQIEAGYVDHSSKYNLSYPQSYKASEKRSLTESEVFENAEDHGERQRVENLQNPKKRRKLVGQEIIDNLSHFMNMNKQKSITLNADNFQFNEESNGAKEVDEEDSVQSMEILTRPLTATKNKRSEQELVHIPKPELQGILKSYTPDSQAHMQDDEKYLRFRLPSIDMNDSESSSSKDNNENKDENEVQMVILDSVEEEEEEEEEVFMQTTNNNDSLKRIKQIARAVSEESAKSAASSNTSEDNFYSPLSSQNNSKLDFSNVSRNSLLSGPKARKPLTRLSAEKEPTPSYTQEQFEESERKAGSNSKSSDRVPTPSAKKVCSMEGELSNSSKRNDDNPLKKLSEEMGTALSSKIYLDAEKGHKSKSKSREFSPTIVKEIKSETELNKDENSKAFVTAAGTNIFNISSRKSLKSVMGEHMDTTKEVTISTKTTYITCVNTQASEMENKTQESQTSSNFESISKRSTFANSKINEFLPKVSSSKVGSTPVKTDVLIDESRPQCTAKLSECTTVLGSFDYTSLGSKNVFAMPSIPSEKSKIDAHPKHTEEQKRQMLETTLSMSTYDISMLDTTSFHTAKTSLITTMEGNEKEKSEQEEKAENQETSENKETSEKLDVKETNEKLHELLRTQVVEEEVKLTIDCDESETENENPTAWGDIMDSSDYYDDSSSTYIDDNDYGRAFDFRSKDGSESSDCKVVFESEKSFDTDDYGHTQQSVANTDENLTSDTFDRETNTVSNDVVELIDTTSSEGTTNANFSEQSCTASSATGIDDEVSDGLVKEDETVVSTTTATQELESRASQVQELPSAIAVAVTSSSEIISSTISALEEDTANKLKDVEIKKANEEQVQCDRQPEIVLEDCAVSELNDEVKIKEVDEKPAVSEQQDLEGNALLSPKHVYNLRKTSEVSEELKDSKEVSTSAVTMETDEQFTLKMEEGDSIDSIDLKQNLTKDVEKKNNIQEDSVLQKDIEEFPDTPKNYRNLRRLSVSKHDLEGSVLTPRKNARGTSVPPLGLDLKAKKVESPRRSTRGSSIPASSLPSKTEEYKKTDENPVSVSSTLSTSLLSSDHDVTDVSTRRSIRGVSVTPADIESAVASTRRNARGISVPPQTTESDELSTTPSHTRRSHRASSLQPKNKMDNDGYEGNQEGTPIKRGKLEEEAIIRSSRGSTGNVVGKVPTRRRSILLDAINEDGNFPDSPSAHTRLRSRLNSIDSDADQSIINPEHTYPSKRTRRSSLSNTPVDVLQLTPKRARSGSISTQSEASNVLTPRTLRGRSVLSTVDDENEVIPPSPKPTKERRITGKRKTSNTEPNKEETIIKNEKQEEEKETPAKLGKKIESPKEDSTLYSTTTRRLTRTQLAVMEKSVALAKNFRADVLTADTNESPPDISKRPAKARSTRSTQHESDDAESTTSKISANSSEATSTRRRVTRKSAKDKDDDDGKSIASSVGSESRKSRRSKDKGSPISILSSIPEDAPIETKKRGRKSSKTVN